MPGAVPRTSTHGLSNATFPYIMKLAKLGFAEAVGRDKSLALGVNTHYGKITYQAVAEAFNVDYHPLQVTIDN
jgi:alanine dehydrogenase